jgi:HSP20 family protein
MERSYGYFNRVIPLPPGISPEKVDAIYKKGILTVRLPKSDEAGIK